jgi:hypothetical protein
MLDKLGGKDQPLLQKVASEEQQHPLPLQGLDQVSFLQDVAG